MYFKVTVAAPPSAVKKKLNAGAQLGLQTFHFPTMPRSFRYSNALMANWRSQTLSFKSVTDKVANQKTLNFLPPPPRRRANSDPTKLGMVIEVEVVRNVLAPPKRFPIRRIYSPLGALKMLGKMHPLNLNPHNSVTFLANPPKF